MLSLKSTRSTWDRSDTIAQYECSMMLLLLSLLLLLLVVVADSNRHANRPVPRRSAVDPRRIPRNCGRHAGLRRADTSGVSGVFGAYKQWSVPPPPENRPGLTVKLINPAAYRKIGSSFD